MFKIKYSGFGSAPYSCAGIARFGCLNTFYNERIETGVSNNCGSFTGSWGEVSGINFFIMKECYCSAAADSICILDSYTATGTDSNV